MDVIRDLLSYRMEAWRFNILNAIRSLKLSLVWIRVYTESQSVLL